MRGEGRDGGFRRVKTRLSVGKDKQLARKGQVEVIIFAKIKNIS